MPTRGAPLPPTGDGRAPPPRETERNSRSGKRDNPRAAAVRVRRQRERTEESESRRRADVRREPPGADTRVLGRAEESERASEPAPPSLSPSLPHDRQPRAPVRTRTEVRAHGTASDRGQRLPARTQEARTGGAAAAAALSLMILPQVHLRKPCYDFYFL